MRKLSILSTFTLACALVLTSLLASTTSAQEATPENGMDVVDVECTHEPRVLDELFEVFGTPAPEGAGVAASLERDEAGASEDFELPSGEPADEETAAAVEHAVAVLVACFNEGHLLAGWGGVSDEFLRSIVETAIFDEDFVAQIEAGPTPLAEELHTVIIGVEGATVLEDGRVGVLFHYEGPAAPGEGIDGLETDYFIFVEVDGVWLLDEVIENLEAIHGPDMMATPEA